MKKALILLAGLLSGCAYTHPAIVSTNALGPNERPIKRVRGEAAAEYYFFVGPFGDNSLAAAVKAAMKGEGDTLANVFVDREVTFVFPLYMERKTIVTGMLVKYENKEPPR